jgi:hypothetical protein
MTFVQKTRLALEITGNVALVLIVILLLVVVFSPSSNIMQKTQALVCHTDQITNIGDLQVWNSSTPSGEARLYTVQPGVNVVKVINQSIEAYALDTTRNVLAQPFTIGYGYGAEPRSTIYLGTCSNAAQLIVLKPHLF